MLITAVTLLFTAATLRVAAQAVSVNPQHHFPKTVPPGNYSGITWLGGERYAVADDKSPTAGFRLMTITLDSLSGAVTSVVADSFMTAGQPNRDEEGICFVPYMNTVFVSGEADGKIVEYDLKGMPTGRRLAVPAVFATARKNGGFEALTYGTVSHRFWTTSENTLVADGPVPTIANKVSNRLRLQSFADDLLPRQQYWYVTDSSEVAGTSGSSFLGVCGLAALDDGRLVVLEREARNTTNYIGSFVHIKLYIVDPARHRQGDMLQKQLLAEFRTTFSVTSRSFANYEGICAGPRLKDGRQVLLLVADSQNQYKGFLHDWFRTVVIDVPTAEPAVPFLTDAEVLDAVGFLPEPPAPGSSEFQSDAYYYQWGKEQRADSAVARMAAADEVWPLADVFSEALGMEISAAGTPEIFRLMEGVRMDARRLNNAAKRHYKRMRPHEYYREPSLVNTADGWYLGSYSYPSGHSIRGWVSALTLSMLAPEAAERLMARGRQFAINRVICGRHWKSDTDAALMEASALMTRLTANDAFRRQLEKAKAEYAGRKNK